MWRRLHKNNKSPFRVIIFGFFLVILAGSLLLMLPISSQQGVVTPFLDALFTSTSAVCVTGLVIHDTATYWSQFGQVIIILLIQIGGLGVVTVAGAFAILSGRKIGLMQRSTMQEAIAAPNVGGIVRLTGFILRTAFAVELLGAALLYLVFSREFGLLQGAWYALFHSISAFCNAGFDLMGVKAPFSSLVDYAGQPVVSLVIALLIVVGGIGFLTWEDIRTNRWHVHKYRMQSKVILTVTGMLILLPTVYFFFFEFAGKSWFTMGGAQSHDIDDGILDPNAPDFAERYVRLRRRHGMFRILRESWWPEEMPSKEEMQAAEQALAARGNKVDFILTHEAPYSSVHRFSNGRYETNELSVWFDKIKAQTQFEAWFHGHHHINYRSEKVVGLYRKIIKLEQALE